MARQSQQRGVVGGEPRKPTASQAFALSLREMKMIGGEGLMRDRVYESEKQMSSDPTR